MLTLRGGSWEQIAEDLQGLGHPFLPSLGEEEEKMGGTLVWGAWMSGFSRTLFAVSSFPGP